MCAIHWQPIKPPHAGWFAMSRRVGDDSDDSSRDPFAEAPAWLRLGLRVFILLGVFGVWTFSMVTRIQHGQEPDLTTFSILGLVVLLGYGIEVKRWWSR